MLNSYSSAAEPKWEEYWIQPSCPCYLDSSLLLPKIKNKKNLKNLQKPPSHFFSQEQLLSVKHRDPIVSRQGQLDTKQNEEKLAVSHSGIQGEFLTGKERKMFFAKLHYATYLECNVYSFL